MADCAAESSESSCVSSSSLFPIETSSLISPIFDWAGPEFDLPGAGSSFLSSECSATCSECCSDLSSNCCAGGIESSDISILSSPFSINGITFAKQYILSIINGRIVGITRIGDIDLCCFESSSSSSSSSLSSECPIVSTLYAHFIPLGVPEGCDGFTCITFPLDFDPEFDEWIGSVAYSGQSIVLHLACTVVDGSLVWTLYEEDAFLHSIDTLVINVISATTDPASIITDTVVDDACVYCGSSDQSSSSMSSESSSSSQTCEFDFPTGYFIIDEDPDEVGCESSESSSSGGGCPNIGDVLCGSWVTGEETCECLPSGTDIEMTWNGSAWVGTYEGCSSVMEFDLIPNPMDETCTGYTLNIYCDDVLIFTDDTVDSCTCEPFALSFNGTLTDCGDCAPDPAVIDFTFNIVEGACGGGGGGDAILMEDSGYVLTEGGDHILLE